MGIKELQGKIRSDAEEEIAEIKAHASKEIMGAEMALKEKIREEEKCILSQGEEAARLLLRETVGGARLAAKLKVLECKRQLLADFFSEVEERILKMPPSGRKKVLAKLLEDAEALGGAVHVYVSEDCKNLVPKKYKTAVGDFKDFGCVIESEDGARRIDNRLSVVLDNLRRRLEPELSKVFWS